jgi:hypothetical protein
MAHWITADSFPAGSITPELHFEAAGLPGILAYWAGGAFQFPSLEEPDTVAVSDPLVAEMIAGQTVGIEPWPADRTPQALISRLSTLTQRACATPLSWITASSLCSQLVGYLDQAEIFRAGGAMTEARGSLGDFVSALGGPTAGTFAAGVSSSAYWLLTSNANIISADLP